MIDKGNFITKLQLIVIFNPSVQIADVWQGHFWDLTDVHTLVIGVFGPYIRIPHAQQGNFSELTDNLTLDIGVFGQYVQIADEWKEHIWN